MMQPGFSQVPIDTGAGDVVGDLDRLYYNELNFVRPLEQGAPVLPLANFAETDDAYLVAVEVPGVDAKDMTLQIVGNQLVLTAFRKPIWSFGGAAAAFTVTEGRFGALRRTIPLPADASTGGTQAQCGLGLLFITIPKTTTAASRLAATTVPINAAL